MSFYILRGISLKFCRPAFILAQRAKVRYPSFPVNVPYVRGSHDGLYQMVKKRSLEARTKVNQPNNQNTNQVPSANSSHASSSSTLSTTSSSKSSIPPFSKGVKTSTQNDHDLINSPYRNVRVLGASGCDNKSDKGRTAPSGCGDSQNQNSPNKDKDCEQKGGQGVGAGGGAAGGAGGGGSSGSGGGQSGDEPGGSKIPKALLLLLAALGAGGLLFWLSRGSKEKTLINDEKYPCGQNEKKPEPPKITPPPNLPNHVPYLLIGGGTAAFSAFRAIKSNDARAKVLMITNECRKPYMRPPLSKELWYTAKSGETTPDYRFKQWTGAERSLFFEPEEFFIDPGKLLDNPNGGIAVAHGLTVKKIDPSSHKVYLNNGMEVGYDNCLIATGCSPKNLPVFTNASPGVKERVMVYRTPEDFERLKRYADKKKSIMIVGNGFIGSELACSLATYAKCKGGKIYQVFSESGNMSRVLPDYLSRWTTRKVQDQGVCVIPNASVRAAQRDENTLKITLNNGNTIITDVVVVCVGCDPNTSLAYSSGLETHPELGGFVVNSELEARQNLFVAGDASCFYDPLLGRRRVEHHDHSVVSGRLAGENMVGKKKPYTHQSMFWSDLGPEIGYEAIGLVDSSLPTVGVFALSQHLERPANSDNLDENRSQANSIPLQNANNVEVSKCDDPEDSYGKGVIFYLKNGKVVGILLWNLFNRIGLARTIINQDRKYDDLNEVAKLFEIHS